MPKREIFQQLLVLGLVVTSLGAVGCNLFGKLDPPGDRADKYAAAIALANAGQCQAAADLLSSILPPDDDVASALGWAEMCLAGASASNIATSLYKFTSSSTDLTVIGTLARAMLPMTSDKITAAQKAITAFNQITDQRRQSLLVAIGDFVEAAAILANQAPNAGSTGLEQIDISDPTCANFASNCAGVGGACAAGMLASDVNTFTNLIADAANRLNTAGAGDLKALASAINTGLLPGGNQARCFIFNRTIPQ